MNTNITLLDVLRKYKNESLLFVEPGGNYGDQLIYEGAFRLAEQEGCNYKKSNYDQFLNGNDNSRNIIYIHGGGGYNQYNSGKSFKLLEKALSIPNAIVIQGPCTIELSENTFTKLDNTVSRRKCKKIYFFARENETFGYLSQQWQNNDVILNIDCDTAFHLDKDYLESKFGISESKYHLDVIRKDLEAPSSNPFRKSAVHLDPAFYAKSFEHWFRLHSHAMTILSNRTHSAIVGAILGKKVVFYGGIYHKNRSIWEYNLKKMGVEWLDDANPEYFQQTEKSPFNWLPKFVRNSYKVTRGINLIKGVPTS